jgi:Beta propeller domain
MQPTMRFVSILLATLVSIDALGLAPACADSPAAPAPQALTSFGSDRNLARFLGKITEAQRRERLRAHRESERRVRTIKKQLALLEKERERVQRQRDKLGSERLARELAELEQKRIAVLLASSLGETLNVSASAAAPAPVINAQESGVDEGGLVKRHGDHLVILRRGRLFTVAIADNDLRPIAAIDAFDPRIEQDSDESTTWYDELLISGDTAVVLGYSYDRGGSEIGLFDIDAAGGLRHRATYHLKSSDYYSAENYASRLVGTTLVIYTSASFDSNPVHPRGLPTLRKWSPSATDGQFTRIASSNRVYQPVQRLNMIDGVVLHTVTTCDLAKPELVCKASVVMGGPQRTFYVSRTAVYVWAADSWQESSQSESMVYRIPIDGAPPSALRVRGTPFNQFSFLESDNEYLNVVVGGATDAAAQKPWTEGLDLSLLRVALDRLADGSTSAPSSSYRPLGRCLSGSVENRFIGANLLVGCSPRTEPDKAAAESTISIVRWASQEATQLDVPMYVSRIEPMGQHALIVGPPYGNWHDLRFVTIRLDDPSTVADTFTFSGTEQRELRSHAFAYVSENATDGMLALPVESATDRDTGTSDTNDEGSGAIVFLRSRSLALEDAGLLASTLRTVDDACRASCVDWYGGARPLFVGDRVFALIGYEIVEGTMVGERMMEVRRASFAPQVTRAATDIGGHP